VKRLSPDADNLDKHFGSEEITKENQKECDRKERDSKA
jgi:hypothetical protein